MPFALHKTVMMKVSIWNFALKLLKNISTMSMDTKLGRVVNDHEEHSCIKSNDLFDHVVLQDHVTNKTILSPPPQCLWLPKLTGR